MTPSPALAGGGLKLSGQMSLRGSDFLRRAPNATPKRWTRYGSFNLTASL